LQDLFEKLIDKGLKLGAEFIDIRSEETIGTNIKIIDSKLKVGSNFNNIGVGIRAFIDGAWGFVSSTILEKGHLQDKLKHAVKMAKLITKNSKIKFKLKERDPVKEKFQSDVKIRISDVDITEKVKFLEEIDKQAKSFDNRIVNTNSIYSDAESTVLICNSFGSIIEKRSSHILCVSMNFSKEGNIRQRGFRSIGESRGYETILSEGAANIGEESAREAIELLSAVSVKGGTYTVLLDPKLSSTFIHEAFGHATEADALVAGESILENKLNKQIGSEFLNVIDDPTIPNLYGSYEVDDEGAIARRTILIENGVLKSYLNNLETASRLNMEGNNARTASFHYYPIVRMSNTHISPGDWKFEEMIENIKDGIYAQGWIRGYTDPAIGTFMFKCAKGNIIKNGEIKELLRDVAISGETLYTLKQIDAVGNDLEFTPGHCGKFGQIVPVADGGPTIRVKNLVVGGLK